MDQFLQKDLLQGHIYYLHSGDESFHDAFDITLADNHQPPNLSPRYVSGKHTSTSSYTYTYSSSYTFTFILYILLIHRKKAFDFL